MSTTSPTGDVMSMYWQAPPIARTLATVAFTTSISIWVLKFHLLMDLIVFEPTKVWSYLPQIWRYYTHFVITMPQLGLLFDTYFLYTYAKALETAHPLMPRREDFIWYLLFVGGVITTISWYMQSGAPGFMLTGLNLAMCRTVTMEQRGQQARIYFFTIPAQLMPFALMLLTMLMQGPGPFLMLEIYGFIAAHLYDFLTRIYPEFLGGRNWIPTPAILSTLFTTPLEQRRSYGTAYRQPSEQPTSGWGSGSSGGSGPLPDSWKSRGAGRRLG